MKVEELRGILEGVVETYPIQARVNDWWRKPLLATVRADDRFSVLPRIASGDHVLPQELLASVKTVVVFFIPFTKGLVVENAPGEMPCRDWGRAYVETNALIGAVGERLRAHLSAKGYACAVTPATHNFDEIRLVSRWSHKHLAHLAGLGRFGHNAQLITPSGCAGRLGSLVTEADLGDNPLMGEREACLHKNGKECLKCVRRCPVRALTEAGLDRERCWARLKSNRRECEAFADLPDNTYVCGKCVVSLPCSLKDPSASSSPRGLWNKGRGRGG